MGRDQKEGCCLGMPGWFGWNSDSQSKNDWLLHFSAYPSVSPCCKRLLQEFLLHMVPAISLLSASFLPFAIKFLRCHKTLKSRAWTYERCNKVSLHAPLVASRDFHLLSNELFYRFSSYLYDVFCKSKWKERKFTENIKWCIKWRRRLDSSIKLCFFFLQHTTPD